MQSIEQYCSYFFVRFSTLEKYWRRPIYSFLLLKFVRPILCHIRFNFTVSDVPKCFRDSFPEQDIVCPDQVTVSCSNIKYSQTK